MYAPTMHHYRRQSKRALRSRLLEMALDFATFAARQRLPLYQIRALRKEAMLLDQFGDGYRHYRARTGALWPRIR
jgi:protein-S-isoprenylcysteine O-methyltransferase Ste14